MKTARRFYKAIACIMAMLFIATLVLYIILMIRSFTRGVDGLTAGFLVVGIIALLIVVPTLANFFMGRGCKCDKYHLNQKE